MNVRKLPVDTLSFQSYWQTFFYYFVVITIFCLQCKHLAHFVLYTWTWTWTWEMMMLTLS